MSGQRLHRVCREQCKYLMVSNMFDQTKINDKFRKRSLMCSLLFFLPIILVKDLQTWKLSQMLHDFHDSYFSLLKVISRN
jgi:hypothetical protein